ncbi:hypothetical protein DIZ27_32895 [Streptomyces sp. NWU339]|uniref:hypothetical protein n=1 Tax=Streptomyces sp. NWU339 TaxID=2185284 RepID=UPI000D680BCF|nr:hypothetical protein [Streptomyces sp. NWU339]PWI06565.1 hypothetical protein DIZ27_32895 [Streptomyces sp. NWU339]
MARVCVDNWYFNVNTDGELTLKPGIQGFRQRIIYRDPGTHQFTKASYPWLARVFVEVQGAGGGSAGANAANGECIARAGGAGGGFSSSHIGVATLGATETIVVGAGGIAGGTASSGGAGGSSSFGGLVVAPGGDGGSAAMSSGTTPNAVSGTPGASASSTDASGGLIAGGGPGGGAIRLSAREALAGAGGESRLGHGGYPRGTEGVGGVPRGRGAGAGGALSYGESVQGTPGGDGLVVVYLFG